MTPRSPDLYVLPLLLALGLATACGSEVGNPKRPNPAPQPGSSLIASDGQAASQVIAAQIDDAINALADDVKNAGLANLQLTGAAELAGNQTCEGGALGTVMLKRDFAGVDLKEFKRRAVTLAFETKGSDKTTRVWKQTDVPLACNDAANQVKINWKSPVNLSLSTAFTRSLTRKLILKATGRILQESAFQSEGTRESSWSAATSTGDVFIVKQTVTSNVTRAGTIKAKSGQLASFVSKISMAPGQPLVLAVERDKTTQSWMSRTIESGTVISTQEKDSRIETTYKDVKFTPAGGCSPVSGSLSGKIYAEAATEPSDTFTVTFAQDSALIRFGRSDQGVYVPDDCDLE